MTTTEDPRVDQLAKVLANADDQSYSGQARVFLAHLDALQPPSLGREVTAEDYEPQDRDVVWCNGEAVARHGDQWWAATPPDVERYRGLDSTPDSRPTALLLVEGGQPVGTPAEPAQPDEAVVGQGWDPTLVDTASDEVCEHPCSPSGLCTWSRDHTGQHVAGTEDDVCGVAPATDPDPEQPAEPARWRVGSESPCDVFAPDGTPLVAGYMVAGHDRPYSTEPGPLVADWDGKVHPTREAGDAELAECRKTYEDWGLYALVSAEHLPAVVAALGAQPVEREQRGYRPGMDCTCGTPGIDYEGPEADCPTHGDSEVYAHAYARGLADGKRDAQHVDSTLREHWNEQAARLRAVSAERDDLRREVDRLAWDLTTVAERNAKPQPEPEGELVTEDMLPLPEGTRLLVLGRPTLVRAFDPEDDSAGIRWVDETTDLMAFPWQARDWLIAAGQVRRLSPSLPEAKPGQTWGSDEQGTRQWHTAAGKTGVLHWCEWRSDGLAVGLTVERPAEATVLLLDAPGGDA